jgi:hypothetical protein
VHSIASISVRSITASGITARRRLAMSPVHLRRPIGIGATTIGLALNPWIDSTPPCAPIRKESADWKLICELLPLMTSSLGPVNDFDSVSA